MEIISKDSIRKSLVKAHKHVFDICTKIKKKWRIDDDDIYLRFKAQKSYIYSDVIQQVTVTLKSTLFSKLLN
jgi:hypothetical protein